MAAIVESSPDAIVGLTVEGVIISWNKSAEKLYGYSKEEALGASISGLIPPEKEAETAQIIDRVKNGHRLEDHPTVRIRKDGSQVAVVLSAIPVLDYAGRIAGIATTARALPSQGAVASPPTRAS